MRCCVMSPFYLFVVQTASVAQQDWHRVLELLLEQLNGKGTQKLKLVYFFCWCSFVSLCVIVSDAAVLLEQYQHVLDYLASSMNPVQFLQLLPASGMLWRGCVCLCVCVCVCVCVASKP